MIIYVIGSLRNPAVALVAEDLRYAGYEVFDDWFAGGEEADEKWMAYEKGRGRSYWDALDGHAANHTFHYDKTHLDRADACVLVAPAGKSAHLELGYMVGKGTPGFIYMTEEPERWDVMVKFATGIVNTFDKLLDKLEYAAHDLGKHSAVNIPSHAVGAGGSDRSCLAGVPVPYHAGNLSPGSLVCGSVTTPTVVHALPSDPNPKSVSG